MATAASSAVKVGSTSSTKRSAGSKPVKVKRSFAILKRPPSRRSGGFFISHSEKALGLGSSLGHHPNGGRLDDIAHHRPFSCPRLNAFACALSMTARGSSNHRCSLTRPVATGAECCSTQGCYGAFRRAAGATARGFLGLIIQPQLGPYHPFRPSRQRI